MQKIKKVRSYKKIGAMLACIGIVLACTKEKDTEFTPQEWPVFGTCKPMPTGTGLRLAASGVYVFTSAGGAQVEIIRKFKHTLMIKIKHQSFENFVYEFWGDNEEGRLGAASHENLSGKHVKDRFGANRTVIFPDGTKMTYVSSAPWYHGGITSITIYDQQQVHHFNMNCFMLEYSASQPGFSTKLDEEQPDGETSTFDVLNDGILFYNIYNEDLPGQKIYKRVDIGRIYFAEPNRVDDLIDDERLAHT